jgi:hypothetical protein
MAALQIPQFYTTEFSKNWEFLAQQTDARLIGAVATTNFQGKRKWFNQIGTGSMNEVVDRKGDTPDGDSTGYKYWIYRRKFEFVRVWDEDDQPQMEDIILPTSDEVTSFTYAENRTKDQVIIQAFGATRFIGENGTDTDALPSGQQIAVDYQYTGSAASAGLTLPKLRRAAYLLNTAEVPMEGRYITYGAKQLDDMLATVEVTSRDYNDVMALKDGKVDRFMGFQWIHTEQLPGNAATGNSTLYAWQKDGVKYADCGRNVYMDILTTKRHAMQLRGVSRMGAIRTENARVVSILCDNTL